MLPNNLTACVANVGEDRWSRREPNGSFGAVARTLRVIVDRLVVPEISQEPSMRRQPARFEVFHCGRRVRDRNAAFVKLLDHPRLACRLRFLGGALLFLALLIVGVPLSVHG